MAVENALKTAFDWKVRHNLKKGFKAEGNKIIHFKDCFHGRSGYTMSLTDSPDPRKVQHFPKFDWPRVLNPSMIFPLNEENIERTKQLENQSINEIKNVLKMNPKQIAGLIIEPIQGEGGDNHFSKEFLIKLKDLSLENDFLLIHDEVQTGVGITGKMWAHQRFLGNKKSLNSENFDQSLVPDVMSFGKKTQVCGILAGDRLNEVENHVFHESSRINSTFGGNLVDMVRFTIYLEIIDKENLLNLAYLNGKYLLESLEIIKEKHTDLVNNVRGKGLWCAFDLPDSESRDKLIEILYQEGLLILGCGVKSTRFRPHLNISKEEIDTASEILLNSLKKL